MRESPLREPTLSFPRDISLLGMLTDGWKSWCYHGHLQVRWEFHASCISFALMVLFLGGYDRADQNELRITGKSQSVQVALMPDHK